MCQKKHVSNNGEGEVTTPRFFPCLFQVDVFSTGGSSYLICWQSWYQEKTGRSATLNWFHLASYFSLSIPGISFLAFCRRWPLVRWDISSAVFSNDHVNHYLCEALWLIIVQLGIARGWPHGFKGLLIFIPGSLGISDPIHLFSWIESTNKIGPRSFYLYFSGHNIEIWNNQNRWIKTSIRIFVWSLPSSSRRRRMIRQYTTAT